MPMGWCPRPVSQTPSRPPERVSEAGILLQRALSVSAQNVRETAVFVLVLAQMLTRPGRGEGSAPGFGVRVMGWYGGEEGEGCRMMVRRALREALRSAVRSRVIFWTSPLHPDLLLLMRPGYVRLCDGFPCYWHNNDQ